MPEHATHATPAAAVIYAKDVSRLSAFYEGVAGLAIMHAEAGYASLESASLQLFIVAMNPDIASRVQIARPPVPRENTALKFIFPVVDIAAARQLATEAGGMLKPASAEWEFNGYRHCDGHDPEGNVFQLRMRAG